MSDSAGSVFGLSFFIRYKSTLGTVEEQYEPDVGKIGRLQAPGFRILGKEII
jgi:hypothetical protein